jgi:hypothetical protein
MPAQTMQNGSFAGLNHSVSYDPGDVTVEMPGGTRVSVEKKEF